MRQSSQLAVAAMSRNKQHVRPVDAETADFSRSLPLSVSLGVIGDGVDCVWQRTFQTVVDACTARSVIVVTHWRVPWKEARVLCRRRDDAATAWWQATGRRRVSTLRRHLQRLSRDTRRPLWLLLCRSDSSLLFSALPTSFRIAVACYKWRLSVSRMSRYDMTWHLCSVGEVTFK